MTEQEARAEAFAEAERRWPDPFVGRLSAIKDFTAGAEWWASRSPVAAPSDTDRETLARIITDMMPNVPLCCSGAAFKSEGHDQNPPCLTVIRGREIADAVLASRTSQPVQVEVTEQAVVTLAKYMANVASDWTDICDDDDHPLEHSNWEAYTDDARAALAALGGGERPSSPPNEHGAALCSSCGNSSSNHRMAGHPFSGGGE